MLEQFLAVGVDIRKEPMQIHPSMHHMMGGVRIDDQGGCNLLGLFAAGEVTGGEHGGNRLGGNALAGCQVMGKRAAASAARYASERPELPEISEVDLDRELARVGRYLQNDERKNAPHAIHQQLQKVMWEKVGIMRRAEELNDAQMILSDLTSELYSDVRAARSQPDYNREWLECLELENMLITAQAVVYAASLRTESRGAHYRHDYPAPRPEWERRNIVIKRDSSTFSHEIVNQSEL
jgi:fumarate reductase (CoM/CoB) subunit A